MKIQTITKEQVNVLVENRKHPDRTGLYLVYDGPMWVAIDNSDGCAWTEEFESRSEIGKRYYAKKIVQKRGINDGIRE